MDITVSISDHRSLSSSEMIRQKLYASIQIGNTSHSGTGLNISCAKFRSGTVENPLVLTVRNSQTETVMYVRNVPISAVLERNGLVEQWIAVYPPGDPQNYQHFDVSALPPPTCPQLCISIAVQEEEEATAARLSFDPQPRLSTGPIASPMQRWREERASIDVGSLSRRSVEQSLGSMPLLPVPEQHTGLDALASSQPVPSQRPFFGPASPSSSVGLDGSFQLKAQRLKEHVAEVASAAKRAQDVTRTLQESLRIRDDMRHQLRGLEEEIAVQQSATNGLKREIGQLRAEESQLKEQIGQRNAVFQELRDNRDGIDRELSRALGEGESHKGQIESSCRDFEQQRQAKACEIEHSKQQVSQLMESLQGREELVAERQRKVREELQAAVSKARADLAGARATLEEQQNACEMLDARRNEALEKLSRMSPGAAPVEDSSPKAAADAKADLENKRGKIETQLAKARRLEGELNENRSQLERMSSRVAELHTEARDKELAVQRCEDARLELQRQLQERRGNAAPFHEQVHASGSHLARAEQEALRAKEALDMVGQADDGNAEAAAIEADIENGRTRLVSVQGELAAVRGTCDDLEVTAKSSRLKASERKTALEAAKGRASELGRRLAAAAAASTTDSGDVLRRLAQDIAACSSRLEEAMRRAGQREEEVKVMQDEGEIALRQGGSRAADLERVAAELRGELELLKEAKELTGMQHVDLQGSLAANQRSLADLQNEIDSLMQEGRDGETQVGKMSQENLEITAQLSAGFEKLAELEEASCVQKSDLDSTKAFLDAKMRQVAEMERNYKLEVEELGRNAESLSQERAEAEREGARLQAELAALESECLELDGTVSLHRNKQGSLQNSLQQSLTGQETLRAERRDLLGQTEQRVDQARTATLRSRDRRERAAGQLAKAKDARKAARCRLATVMEEAEGEVGKASVAQSQLEGRKLGLAALHSELEEHQTKASQMERLRAKLALESKDFVARLERAHQATLEVQRLELRLLDLQEQFRTEEARLEREAKEQLLRRGAEDEALQRREAEISRHLQQIVKLEAEQRDLQQQAGRLDAERRALEEGLSERERERRDALEACRDEAMECERLESEAQEARGLAQRLEHRDTLRRNVIELEESLQRLGDSLVEAQELVRREHTEEEELRLDIQKLKESIMSTNDKALYQGEHGSLQFETIQKLEEQKKRSEQELELLTLGLHDAEQRNDFLESQNRGMQQQVEGLYSGSLQDWAVEVRRAKGAELVRYKEEIEAWKLRAEKARKDRSKELTVMQRQHEERERHLRDRIAGVRAELDRCEQAARRREAALARRQERGEAAPAGPMPGLVVPQRPLPTGAGRRRALLVGANYATSHAPLKGCVNDVWNLQCLLRYTLQYSEDQLQVLLDSADGRPAKPKRAPTKANIIQGLQWLMGSAQPGDSLLFVFCGYGAQHPRSPGAEEHEAYLVPTDFAADLPPDFFRPNTSALVHRHTADLGATAGYRLLSMLELHDWVSRLPATCRMSMMIDCCYSVLPRVSPATNFPPTFPKVDWGDVNYARFRDFISRPRFLELPVLPVQHTPGHLRAGTFPSCSLHCFSGCKREEWCAEFPIEGTVQGAFSWAFLKALAKAHFHCGVYQFQQVLGSVISDLRTHFRAVEQTPLVQLSAKAGMQDVVLWT